jgi:superfamily II DNA or RNA helicase
MSATLKLRDYQEEALGGIAVQLRKYNRVAVVLPTGMGKTVVFAHLIKATVEAGHRAIVLVHRDELVNQAVDKIGSVMPGVQVGVVKAERNEITHAVIVASVQTLTRERRRAAFDRDTFGVIIVDEAHHAAAKTWIEVLEHLGAWPDANGHATPTVGFSATLAREDGKGLGDVWQRVAYKKDILEGIVKGHLVDVKGRQVTVDGLDLAEVARSRGDYQDGALGDALEASGAGEIIAQSYLEHAADRQGVLFAPTVSTAYAFAADLNAAGVVTEVIVGTTPPEDRKLIYKRYKEGEVQVLSNAMVLTEGWDAPWASCAVIARPTGAAGLYTQMVGRVLRPWPGKTVALVLDVVGVSSRIKLRSLVDLSETGVAPEPGETMGEAWERHQRERGKAKSRITGTVASSDVDLFDRSHSAWLRTYAGVWFIPTKTDYVFLWPQGDELWNVGRKAAQGRGGEWVQSGLTLEYALAWGEQVADEIDPSIARKTSSWRRAGNTPTDAQMAIVARNRLSYVEGMSRSDVSNMISIHFASMTFDRMLTRS